MAWNISFPGQRCLHILTDVQVHKGTVWKNNRRLWEGNAGYQNACTLKYLSWGCKSRKTKEEEDVGRGVCLLLAKLAELKTHKLCPIVPSSVRTLR